MLKNRQCGFTLVEFTITLSIIAVLVAAMFFGGRALMDSATRKTAVSRVAELRGATAQFRERYHFLPGDITDTSVIAGLVAKCTGSVGNGLIETGESACAAEQLVKSGFVASDVFAPIASYEPILVSREGATTLYSQVVGGAPSVSINARISNVILMRYLSCDAAQAVDNAFDDGDLVAGRVVSLDGACIGDSKVWLAVALW